VAAPLAPASSLFSVVCTGNGAGLVGHLPFKQVVEEAKILEFDANVWFRSIAATSGSEGIVKKNRKIQLFRTSNPNRFACRSRPDTIPAPSRSQGDRHGAWRSLVAHLLWEHDAPIPNEN
jgi:hypothetical protein